MFERFTDKARTSLAVASAEAERLGHNFLGTEHVLLGLLQSGGVAAQVLASEGLTVDAVRDEVRRRVGSGSPTDAESLRSIGIDLDEVRSAVEGSFGPGALERPVKAKGVRWRTRRPFVPRAKKVLELGLREALGLGHNYIGTEHVLLAIVRLGEGVAFEILRDRIGDPAALRPKVLEVLRQAS